jgi:hypothetical protein
VPCFERHIPRRLDGETCAGGQVVAARMRSARPCTSSASSILVFRRPTIARSLNLDVVQVFGLGSQRQARKRGDDGGTGPCRGGVVCPIHRCCLPSRSLGNAESRPQIVTVNVGRVKPSFIGQARQKPGEICRLGHRPDPDSVPKNALGPELPNPMSRTVTTSTSSSASAAPNATTPDSPIIPVRLSAVSTVGKLHEA